MMLLAQIASATDPFGGWLEAIAKVGLGVASFAALIWYLRWMAAELKESRVAFLLQLDKQHTDHATENHLLAQAQERNTDRVVNAIDGLQDEIRQHWNGRDRAANGGRG